MCWQRKWYLDVWHLSFDKFLWSEKVRIKETKWNFTMIRLANICVLSWAPQCKRPWSLFRCDFPLLLTRPLQTSSNATPMKAKSMLSRSQTKEIHQLAFYFHRVVPCRYEPGGTGWNSEVERLHQCIVHVCATTNSRWRVCYNNEWLDGTTGMMQFM